MRRAKREVADLAELRGIVEKCPVVRVGSHDAEGVFVVPMSFGYELAEPVPGEAGDARWTFWLHCASEGRKTDAWAADPRVATRATDADQKARGLTAIMAHMAPGAPVEFSPDAVKLVDVWRVDVDHLTGKRRE